MESGDCHWLPVSSFARDDAFYPSRRRPPPRARVRFTPSAGRRAARDAGANGPRGPRRLAVPMLTGPDNDADSASIPASHARCLVGLLRSNPGGLTEPRSARGPCSIHRWRTPRPCSPGVWRRREHTTNRGPVTRGRRAGPLRLGPPAKRGANPLCRPPLSIRTRFRWPRAPSSGSRRAELNGGSPGGDKFSRDCECVPKTALSTGGRTRDDRAIAKQGAWTASREVSKNKTAGLSPGDSALDLQKIRAYSR